MGCDRTLLFSSYFQPTDQNEVWQPKDFTSLIMISFHLTTWERGIYLAFCHFQHKHILYMTAKGVCECFLLFFNKTMFSSFFKAVHRMSNSDHWHWCSKQKLDKSNSRDSGHENISLQKWKVTMTFAGKQEEMCYYTSFKSHLTCLPYNRTTKLFLINLIKSRHWVKSKKNNAEHGQD